MAAYFASDVHLRLDHPERGQRFARFVGGLVPGVDTLTIVGDLCDFWSESRQQDTLPLACEGLVALVEFRKRGGAVAILVGNHDNWMGPLYTSMGLTLCDEPLELVVRGLRVHLVHGHRVEARRGWKAWMEGRVFLKAFKALPGSVASALDHLLQLSNERSRERTERRYFAKFRRYAAGRHGTADLVVIGHVHTPLDAKDMNPRLIVPGGWHRQTSYVKIDEVGAVLHIETDQALVSR